MSKAEVMTSSGSEAAASPPPAMYWWVDCQACKGHDEPNRTCPECMGDHGWFEYSGSEEEIIAEAMEQGRASYREGLGRSEAWSYKHKPAFVSMAWLRGWDEEAEKRKDLRQSEEACLARRRE